MRGRPRQPTQARLCLKCRNEFDSEGPHNRLCSGCKITVSNAASSVDGTTGHRVTARRGHA